MKSLIAWYDTHKRDLPWRAPTTTPWGILVSEVMLQQTPAARVAPVWLEWMERWPTPEDLAAVPSARILQAWDRLGYPRRALRLQEAAAYIIEHYEGHVPRDTASLRAIPGVGEYTAAAVQAFAFDMPAVVLDVNVRRVLTRCYGGVDLTHRSITHSEREYAACALQSVGNNPHWNAAVMEFGALVCTHTNPRCTQCPVVAQCAWRAAGYPEPSSRPPTQKWKGTDRQARGAMMSCLRAAPDFTASVSELLLAWPDRTQAERAIRSLAADDLIHPHGHHSYALGKDD